MKERTTAKRPVVAKPVARKAAAGRRKAEPKMPQMKEVEVLLFTSELADLLEAGMTLGQALSCLANQGEEASPQRVICRDLCDRIVNGEAFSDAVKHHPRTFQPLYGNMIKAGESSGAMIEVLRRLVDHYERNDSMKGKIKSALSYPCVVLCFGVIAVIAALVWIIPQFQKVFDSMGAALPLPTRILIGASHAFIHYGWFMAAGVVALVIWFRKWAATPSGRLKVDGWKLKAPLIKGIIANGVYASLAFTLKTLLSNGVNVLNALKIAEETCGNAVIGKAISVARKRVTDGTTISGPLAASGAFPRMMTDMLAVGEQAGDMASSLENIGKRYQKDMDRNITAFTNALEPILIVTIAAVVGFVAVAILMAVFNMSKAIG
ncbi:MAG: type II secretion system F family protein [Kiritimatiellae bacterium]|nr:type II secretion system F family protein [Kiritimatiellia bacterium]